MNRRERRREGREAKKAIVTHSMTRDQLAGMLSDAEQAAQIAGKKEGIRLAVTACMAAYTVAMESAGYGSDTIKVISSANEEVFKLLGSRDMRTGEYDLDIETVKEYAKRCGVDLSWIG